MSRRVETMNATSKRRNAITKRRNDKTTNGCVEFVERRVELIIRRVDLGKQRVVQENRCAETTKRHNETTKRRNAITKRRVEHFVQDLPSYVTYVSRLSFEQRFQNHLFDISHYRQTVYRLLCSRFFCYEENFSRVYKQSECEASNPRIVLPRMKLRSSLFLFFGALYFLYMEANMESETKSK